MTYIYHVAIIIAYLADSDSIEYKNAKDNILYEIKQPSYYAKKSLRTGLDLDFEGYEGLTPQVPTENVQDENDAEESRKPKKKFKKIKKTRFKPKSNFFDRQDKDENVKKRPKYNHEKEDEEHQDEDKKVRKRPKYTQEKEDEEHLDEDEKLRKRPKYTQEKEDEERQDEDEKEKNVPKYAHEKEDEEGRDEDEKVRKKPKHTHEKEDQTDFDVGDKDLIFNEKQRIEDVKDANTAREKVKILNKAKKYEAKLNSLNMPRSYRSEVGKERYHMDPVLNVLRSHSYRRQKKKSDSDDISTSSSREMKKWKDEFKDQWEQKKWEALNQSRPRGDVVNMAAARPWGVPCGDPNQHDMPWGTCMMSMECESEYRIYRGDFLCGRTQFVCCALQLTSYDLYQGLDASFDDKSLSTDSDERKGSSDDEKKKKKNRKKKRKRQRDRKRRKKKIKKNIRKIVREIRKILNRHYKNGTRLRKRKTKQLKKFIKLLKKQYKKDRQSVKDVHEMESIKIDIALMQKLLQIRDLNNNFMKNSTFREIIVNGTATKQGMRMLVEAYPELQEYIKTRRSGNGGKPDDYLEYDIEYGLLYY